MSRETTVLTEELLTYIRKIGIREDNDLRLLREETASHPAARMQISPEQGQFMMLLIELIGARKTFEVGVFTGYSTMCAAKAMGGEGRVVALDISEEYTSVAQRHWKASGLAECIDLRIAPAEKSLQAMILAGESASYDFAFIDADKTNYDSYFEHALKLVRPGGLIAIDNVLWHGAVVDPENQEEDTIAIRHINEKLAADERITLSLVPIGDGLSLARKR
ncbi:MAG: SAM-dependent methyltransferase [Candidatus Marinimicrobia bacterium]|nr:SAM-dependent methyltransferase [Candidatus Neomarinimicrobiota bacterium]